LPVIIEPLLRERVNWGDAPEQEFADFMAMWERSSRERDWQPPVGDSSRAAGQRLEQFIQAQQKQHPQATILAVTHGGVLADF
jgi:broad specificity phosphatase PhoE